MSRNQKPKWRMPKWMEQYRHLIGNTGGNEIDDLMNDRESNFHNNYIRTALIVAVTSQVELLHRLYDKGLLQTHNEEESTN